MEKPALPTAAEILPETAATPRLSPSKFGRSAKTNNPWAGIDLRSRTGKAVYDQVCLWLAETNSDASDLQHVKNLIACAQLEVRCQEARGNPEVSEASLSWLENSLFRRRRQVGLSNRRSGVSKVVR